VGRAVTSSRPVATDQVHTIPSVYSDERSTSRHELFAQGDCLGNSVKQANLDKHRDRYVAGECLDNAENEVAILVAKQIRSKVTTESNTLGTSKI
jgi:hypothetical protein